MSVTPARWGTTISTPYGEARVNSSGRVLWAEWDVWRHSEELVRAGVWVMNRCRYGAHERLEFYVAEQQDRRVAANPSEPSEQG